MSDFLEVARPRKKSEYQIIFGSKSASKSWKDLIATQRNSVVDAWDFLTKSPAVFAKKSSPLKGKISTVTRAGVVHERWQLELQSGARIWYYVMEEEKTVVLEQVHTRHPNETK